MCNVLYCMVTTGIIIAISLAIGLYFGLFNEADIESVTGIDTPSLPPFFWNDPYNGVPSNSTSKWNTDGTGGLALEVVNALDDTWTDIFNEAISDWESGTPDALSLTTSTADRDTTCQSITGVMKVCNYDYGETGWRGINEYVTSSDVIIHSIAKMNEFYLLNADGDERLYTMCHEVGHGFGLAHTDENFGNTPLGNCLDYTNRFEDNLRPGEVNYEILADKYGEVGTRRNRHQKRDLSSTTTTAAAAAVQPVPDWVMEKYKESLISLSPNGVPPDSQWTILSNSSYGAQYKIDLGKGYGATVSMLKPKQ